MNQKNKKGFTLVEMLVALAIFGLLAGAFTGFMMSAIQAQRRILTTQQLFNNASYVLEYMSRTIRMAKKDVDGKCTGIEGRNYSTDGSSLTFLHYQQQECQKFFLENGVLKEQRTNLTDNSTSTNNLTPDNFKVTEFTVTVSGDETNSQPKVTLKLTIQGKEEKPELQPKLTLQTSISQRDLNISQ
ncbi:MAG: PulJ/GspJ family protein [Minisyncoccales bacterium]